MDVVLRFVIQEPVEQWVSKAENVVDLFSQQAGFLGAKVGLAFDDDAAGLISMNFDSVGNYRRALSSHVIKLEATEFLSQALDEPSAYETLVSFNDGEKTKYQSEKTSSAEEIALGTSAKARAQSRLEQ